MTTVGSSGADSLLGAVAVTLLAVWVALGYYMLIFMAGLQAIPMEIYDAAVVDGANPFQTWWFITLPGLRQQILVAFVITFIAAMRLFDLIFVLTSGGGPGKTTLVPADADAARQMRLRDRFYDLYVNVPMQKIVTDRLRPAGKNDLHGVEEAKTLLQTALGMIDRDMAGKTWAMGDAFTMADCAAAPPLFYANKVLPFGDTHPNVAAYFERLMQRSSYARIINEAQPYMHLFPG